MGSPINELDKKVLVYFTRQEWLRLIEYCRLSKIQINNVIHELVIDGIKDYETFNEFINLKFGTIMLNKKDEFFDWFRPAQTGRYKMGEVFRVAHTKKRNSITISGALLEKLGFASTNGSTLKVAISFDKDNPFIVIGPNKGVPFVIFRKFKGGKSFIFNNKETVEKFVSHFNLEKRCAYFDFELEPWEKLNGMTLLRLHLKHEIPCE